MRLNGHPALVFKRRKALRFKVHSLWDLPGCSAHVLQGTVENHLFRITLMGPGFWQDLDDVA